MDFKADLTAQKKSWKRDDSVTGGGDKYSKGEGLTSEARHPTTPHPLKMKPC